MLLTACTAETVQPKEQIQEKNDENIVVTKDGKITFEIKNDINVPKEKVVILKDEILKAYDNIQQSIHTSYVPSDKITI